MNDDEWLLILIFAGLVVIGIVLLAITGISNRLESILYQIGVPGALAADIGGLVFAILLLGVIAGAGILIAKVARS